MKKFKRIYRRVCTVIAIIAAITLTFIDAITYDELIAKFNNPPESEDYQLLKDYAMVYAKTLNTNSIDDESVEITHNIEADYLTITVNEFRCGVEATFPIELKSSENEGELIVTVSYRDVTYKEYSNLNSIGFYIAILILCVMIATVSTFLAIYYPVIFIIWIINKIKKRTSQE